MKRISSGRRGTTVIALGKRAIGNFDKSTMLLVSGPLNRRAGSNARLQTINARPQTIKVKFGMAERGQIFYPFRLQ